MKRKFLYWIILVLLTSCHKANTNLSSQFQPAPVSDFIQYNIPQDQHSSDKNTYKTIETSELNFIARFDSSAIYKTQLKENQNDINKLYGFSDNNGNHHLYSARFGWRWSNNALRLFAYVYNEGEILSKELATVTIGVEITCSIKADSSTYIFSVNKQNTSMPRLSKTYIAKGYMLYPYFGGDETAPHKVKIWIKQI